MALVDVSALTEPLRGRIGDVVFRRVNGRLFASFRPKPTQVPNTPAQRTHQRRFAEAARWAKAAQHDPVLKAVYAPIAADRGMAPYTVALGDWFNPPEIQSIDCSGYTRATGGRIRIVATDDVAVRGVRVTLKNASTGEVLAAGEAVAVGDRWDFATARAVPAGVPLSVEVAATDHPGHTVTTTQAIS